VDLRTLRAFVVLAEERHFHRAAERLFIAQPALSQTIKRLEKQLHVALFIRTTRSVELTDAGRVLLVEARQVLIAADRALSAVRHAASGELGTVRIGFVASAALGLVPTILLAVQQRWPRLELELVEATTGEQLIALRSGELDIGIAREAHPSPDLLITPLAEDRLVAAVPTGHSLADRGRVALRDLRDEVFIAPPRGATPLLSDHISALCAAAGFRQTVAHEALQFPTILGLVAANTGIAIVPEAMRVLRLPGLSYLELDDKRATSLLSVITTTARAETALLRNVITAIYTAGNPVTERGRSPERTARDQV